jgi:hypothetical protein
MARRQANKARDWPNVEDFYSHASHRRCLKLIWREIGAAAGVDEDSVLLPYQRTLLRDLEDGLDEQALAHLHEYWNYDFDQLMKRGRKYNPGVPAKPRIDLSIEMSSHGNLKAEWYPTGYDQWGRTGESDFTHFWRSEHRSGGWDSRPSNEIFFLHDASYVVHRVDFPEGDDRPVSRLNPVLLRCCTALWENLKARLDQHFEVRLLTDIFETFERVDDGSWMGRDVLVKWEIDDPERRQNEEELAEWRSIPERHGFSIEQFEDVWAESLKKKGTGPSPNEHTAPPKVAKALRSLGYEISKPEVERIRYLLDKHGPKSGNVIPFERNS